MHKRKNRADRYREISPSRKRSTMAEKFEIFQLDEQEASSLNLSYNQRVRPLLDVVDRLRNLNIMKEGIELPSIVVVGDQSSGKSSVLESLAGISLPRGQGICTRVPLIMRLQKCEGKDCGIVIEYKDKKKHIAESQITDTLNSVTREIAGTSKGISNTPITLHVKKVNVPDLTMVDLPGITRVPVQGQPEDIYEQISKIIMQYISPNETIILNVLSATVDFPTCESIRMSQRVDEHGKRTLAVVTKVDKAPEGLLEKVTVDAVNIGLGYVCVRNRVGDESHEEARKKEAHLFSSHSQLSTIDKSMVGIPVLAKRLMQIQANSIGRCLPDIVKKIDETHSQRQSELSSLPRHISNPFEALNVFMGLMNGLKITLNKLLIDGDYREFSEETEMHCAARLSDLFDTYNNNLSSTTVEDKQHFLVRETKLCEEAKGIGLPNFLPRSVFVNLLQNPINEILRSGLGLTGNVWDYVEEVVLRVIKSVFQSYPYLQTAAARAFHALVSERKDECIQYVSQLMEMEKSIDFTLNPMYMETWTQLFQQKDNFMKGVATLIVERHRCPKAEKTVSIQGIGEVDVTEVMKMKISKDQFEVAFDMKMRLIAYWKVVIQRVRDRIPLYLQYVCKNLIVNKFEGLIMKEMSENNLNTLLEKMMEESPNISTRRNNLKTRIDSLLESKKEVAKIIAQKEIEEAEE